VGIDVEAEIKTGLLLILSGPSGVGKDSICRLLTSRNPNIVTAISATTRKPRPQEKDGVHYYFLSREEFERRQAESRFLEWAELYGDYYGTPCCEVERLSRQGKDIILEVDTQGAMQLKAACPQGVFIFICPPALADLEQRLYYRNTEDEENRRLRLAIAEQELAQAAFYDYIVVNEHNKLKQTVEKIEAIIAREKSGGKSFE
jgi:guanylate kinase